LGYYDGQPEARILVPRREFSCKSKKALPKALRPGTLVPGSRWIADQENDAG
jgi:hypothetical protein